MSRLQISLIALLTVSALAYLATGFCSVAPGEVVVVRRLGAFLEPPWTAGLHWGWPLGFEQRERVQIDAIRRLEVGLIGIPEPDEEPGLGEFLTGDRNLVQIRAVIQYRVDDPIAFVRAAFEFEPLLARLAESSLAATLSRRGIDGVLREQRGAIGQEAGEELARLADHCGLGLSILGLNLTDARPPVEVQAAFDDAQASRSDRSRRLLEARSYAEALQPEALADSAAILDQARAESRQSVLRAQARADRFVALLEESRRDPALTVQAFYYDTLRELLPRLHRKLVLTPGEPLDLSLFGASE